MKNLIVPKKQKDLNKLENLGAEIIFDPQEEDINIFDQLENEEVAQRVADDYNSGNFAAWFCAHVVVKYRGFEGEDYLGCCSYKSFKQFTSAEKDYYIDMVRQSVEQVNKDIEEHNADIQKRWNIRKATNLVAPYGMAIYPADLSIYKIAS